MTQRMAKIGFDDRRVVISGMGAVSCLGHELSTISESLKLGRSGIDVDPERQTWSFRSPLTGTLSAFDDTPKLSRKIRKTMGQPARYAWTALHRALDDAELEASDIQNRETTLLMGNDSTVEAVGEGLDNLAEHKSPRYIGSSNIIQAMNSTVTINLASQLKIGGGAWTISAACASGAHAIGQGYMLLKMGLCERALCGGAQEIAYRAMASFDALGAFAKYQEGDDPTQASRPFDAHRTGLVPSGGAAVLVLETLQSAKKRGANIYAEIESYAFASDGQHLTAPCSLGSAYTMRRALDFAGLDSGDIDYVNAHATATPRGDEAEGLAILDVFGENGPKVSSTKSLSGHECWMAGASEVIYTCLMMKDGFVAGNKNLVELDPALKGLNVAAESCAAALDRTLSNSFGFGGTNACLVLRNAKRLEA